MQAEDQGLKKEEQQLLSKVIELEEQQKIIYESNDSYTKELKEHLASLTADLEAAKEQQVSL